ncbi:hypothetical protein [Saccharopolyspora sp. 6M]|uniref:hypothetical protein n=1 Tax=Saccharopolyspora sp. 6M TaxID=2877237 RepID=UPI001CD1D149|nr:hypothetical protein [Saccharopolyspora sp. 6M]MCA1225360.1 hypothetical protein [Saccharopolyspora sp. 6M]
MEHREHPPEHRIARAPRGSADAAVRRVAPVQPRSASELLDMQRLAGNAAVTQALGSRPEAVTAVQRQTGSSHSAETGEQVAAGAAPAPGSVAQVGGAAAGGMDRVLEQPRGNSLVVGWPRSPEPSEAAESTEEPESSRPREPRRRRAWKLFPPRFRGEQADSGPGREDPIRDDLDDEFAKMITAVGRNCPGILEDPKVVFDRGDRCVLVAHHPRVLSDLYPYLVTELVKQPGVRPIDSVLTGAAALAAHGRRSAETGEHWSAQDDRVAALQQEAVREAWSSGRADPAANPVAARDHSSPDEALEALLRNPDADGFVLGESHYDKKFLEFLAGNLSEAKSAGLRVIYLESFRAEHQELIDQYLEGAEPTPTGGLGTFLQRYKDRWLHDSLLRLLIGVKRIGGIRIRGIDTVLAERERSKGTDPDVASDWSSHKRVAMLNTFASNTVRADQVDAGGRYMIVAGESHVGPHTFRVDRTTLQGESAVLRGDGGANRGLPDEVPGIADYLGIPAVRMPEDAVERRFEPY